MWAHVCLLSRQHCRWKPGNKCRVWTAEVFKMHFMGDFWTCRERHQMPIAIGKCVSSQFSDEYKCDTVLLDDDAVLDVNPKDAHASNCEACCWRASRVGLWGSNTWRSASPFSIFIIRLALWTIRRSQRTGCLRLLHLSAGP